MKNSKPLPVSSVLKLDIVCVSSFTELRERGKVPASFPYFKTSVVHSFFQSTGEEYYISTATTTAKLDFVYVVFQRFKEERQTLPPISFAAAVP